MVICCGGDAEVLGPATFAEVWYREPEALEVERKSGLWEIK